MPHRLDARCLALAVGLLAGATAQAQSVYRCGNTYSSTPCEGGRAVEASDPRSGEQVKAARDQARREQAAGKALQREREQAEAAQAKAEAAARKAEAAQPRQAAAPAQQTQGGRSASTSRKGCVPSATVRCPEFVAVDPAPAKK